jgi:hypothetical protein
MVHREVDCRNPLDVCTDLRSEGTPGCGLHVVAPPRPNACVRVQHVALAPNLLTSVLDNQQNTNFTAKPTPPLSTHSARSLRLFLLVRGL